MKRSSAKEIATALNLSVSTVYRVLNNTGRISEATRKQVLAYAETVGYQPNLIAQGLAKRKKYHILHVTFSSPSGWWDQIRLGAQKAAQELSEFGVKVTFVECAPFTPHYESLGLLETVDWEMLDGIVLVPLSHPEIIKMLEVAQERNIPVVCINADAPLSSQRLLYYGPNEETVGLLAGELVGKMINGKGNISIVGSESTDFYRLTLRKSGFFQQIYKYFPNINILHQNAFPLNNFRKYLCDMLKESGSLLSAIYVEDSMLLSETANMIKGLNLSNIVVVGHECLDDCKELIEEGWISATICQETFSQGYYPLKLLYHHLLTGAPVKANYHSNVNVVCRSSLGFLEQNEDGCGFR